MEPKRFTAAQGGVRTSKPPGVKPPQDSSEGWADSGPRLFDFSKMRRSQDTGSSSSNNNGNLNSNSNNHSATNSNHSNDNNNSSISSCSTPSGSKA